MTAQENTEQENNLKSVRTFLDNMGFGITEEERKKITERINKKKKEVLK